MGWHLVTGREAGIWVASQINGSRAEGTEAIGLWRADGTQDSFVAGVLYEQWNGKSIVAHIAVTGRMTPAFLAAIFHYPFIACGAHKVICPIPSDNVRSLSLAQNMGFIEEARIKDAAPTGDICIHTLTKQNCRFLKDRYGKKCTSRPRSA